MDFPVFLPPNLTPFFHWNLLGRHWLLSTLFQFSCLQPFAILPTPHSSSPNYSSFLIQSKFCSPFVTSTHSLFTCGRKISAPYLPLLAGPGVSQEFLLKQGSVAVCKAAVESSCTHSGSKSLGCSRHIIKTNEVCHRSLSGKKMSPVYHPLATVVFWGVDIPQHCPLVDDRC